MILIMTGKRRFKRGIRIFSVSMPTEMYEALRDYSEFLGVPVSEVIRRAVMVYIPWIRRKMREKGRKVGESWMHIETIDTFTPVDKALARLGDVEDLIRRAITSSGDGEVTAEDGLRVIAELQELAYELKAINNPGLGELFTRLVKAIGETSVERWREALGIIREIKDKLGETQTKKIEN